MFDYPRFYSTIKESNRINSAKEYIARKKNKSSKQTHKGTKTKFRDQFNPGGVMHT